MQLASTDWEHDCMNFAIFEIDMKNMLQNVINHDPITQLARDH